MADSKIPPAPDTPEMSDHDFHKATFGLDDDSPLYSGAKTPHALRVRQQQALRRSPSQKAASKAAIEPVLADPYNTSYYKASFVDRAPAAAVDDTTPAPGTPAAPPPAPSAWAKPISAISGWLPKAGLLADLWASPSSTTMRISVETRMNAARQNPAFSEADALHFLIQIEAPVELWDAHNWPIDSTKTLAALVTRRDDFPFQLAELARCGLSPTHFQTAQVVQDLPDAEGIAQLVARGIRPPSSTADDAGKQPIEGPQKLLIPWGSDHESVFACIVALGFTGAEVARNSIWADPAFLIANKIGLKELHLVAGLTVADLITAKIPAGILSQLGDISKLGSVIPYMVWRMQMSPEQYLAFGYQTHEVVVYLRVDDTVLEFCKGFFESVKALQRSRIPVVVPILAAPPVPAAPQEPIRDQQPERPQKAHKAQTRDPHPALPQRALGYGSSRPPPRNKALYDGFSTL